jgi:hypothetical protein
MKESNTKGRTHEEDKELRIGVIILICLALLMVVLILMGVLR